MQSGGRRPPVRSLAEMLHGGRSPSVLDLQNNSRGVSFTATPMRPRTHTDSSSGKQREEKHALPFVSPIVGAPSVAAVDASFSTPASLSVAQTGTRRADSSMRMSTLRPTSSANESFRPSASRRGDESTPYRNSTMRDYRDNRFANTVTVFGFPTDKAWTITERFQQYGEIVRRWEGSGNWVHIQYKHKVSAQRALGQNGKKIQSDLMIGVQPLHESGIDQFAQDFDASYVENDPLSTKGNDISMTATYLRRRQERRKGALVDPRDSERIQGYDGRSNVCTRMLSYFFDW